MATGTFSGKDDPVVRKISTSDIGEALSLGLKDFQAVPRYGVILGGVCALVGLSVISTLFVLGLPYLAYPLAAGFAIVSPSIAAILYEISRRLEIGEKIACGDIWRTVMRRSEVRWLGFMTLFVFIMWMYQVRLLVALFLGYSGMGASLGEFIETVLTTTSGLIFLLLGNIDGLILSAVLFTLSVISFPLVLDRGDVDFVTAMVTSVKAVVINPKPMLLFAAIIGALLIASTLTGFLGLLVVMPILGHATWHLYRKTVVPPAAHIPALTKE